MIRKTTEELVSIVLVPKELVSIVLVPKELVSIVLVLKELVPIMLVPKELVPIELVLIVLDRGRDIIEPQVILRPKSISALQQQTLYWPDLYLSCMCSR